jgi:hypothetical protein
MENKTTQKKPATVEERKKLFALFILFFPGLVAIFIPTVVGDNFLLPFALKILLVFYQFVILKNFLDSYYY